MKKIFAFLMFAAAMMTACNEPEPGPGPGPGTNTNDGDEFYGMTLDQAEVLNRGDYYNNGTNSYIIYMYKMEGKDASRIFVGEIVTPEVNDGVIPEGKYEINSGLTAGGLDNMLTGSYFIRNTEDGYIMVVTGGYFEVKHVDGGGYQLTASFSGVNASDMVSTVTPAEGRFTGTPTMMGLPANNNFSVYTPSYAQATYNPADGYAAWEIILADDAFLQDAYPSHMTDIIILTEDLGAGVLPQGTFPVDYLQFGGINTQYFNVNITATSADSEVEDYARDGYVTIKAQGEGKYSIESVAYGEQGAYKQKFNGTVYLYSNAGTTYNIDVTQALFGGNYNGNTWWLLFLGDTNADRLFYIYLNTPAGNNAAAGIPSGTYVVSDTSDVGTVDVGFIDNEGYVNGSMVTDIAQSSVYTYLTGGSITIQNNGDSTYAIQFEFKDHNKKSVMGTYSGSIPVKDQSQKEATVLNIDLAGAQYVAQGVWNVVFGDQAKDRMVSLYYFLEETADPAAGLPTGNYPVAETGAAGTIYAGYQSEQGLGGSLLVNCAYTSAYDLILGGESNVTNNGDGTYVIDFLFEGMSGEYAGEFNGTLPISDGTQTGVAPKKANIKMAPTKQVKAEPTMKLSRLAGRGYVEAESILNF